jgi:hypothetical protein
VKGFAVLAVTAFFGLTYYVGRCAWFPLAACWRCKGEGKFRSLGGRGKTWRLCRRCKGTGSRIRPGRMIWDRMHTAHQREKRAAK